MQLGLAPARRRSAAEQEARDALCCTSPTTIAGARAAIEYVMTVEDFQGNSGSTGVSREPPGLAAPTDLGRHPLMSRVDTPHMKLRERASKALREMPRGEAQTVSS
jgi:hypothetical protein